MDGQQGKHVNQENDTKCLRLIACPTLVLERGRIDRYVFPGMTVAQHLREIGWKPNMLFGLGKNHSIVHGLG